jgi:hypothetical protein
MRSRSGPRRLRDGPRVVLGALAVLGWAGAGMLVFGSISDAGRTTGGWVRRDRTLGDFALAWLSVPAAIVVFVVATLLLPVLIVRGALSLRVLLKQRKRALELRHVASEAAGERAVFVSYRTAAHGPDAQAISQALQAAGQSAWLDAEHGTLPTHLFFVDRVLEEAVRNARAVVVLHQAGDEDGAYEETRLDRIDLGLATALRWVLFAPFAIFGAMCAVLLVPLLPLVVAAEPPRAAASVLPPSVRSRWYRSLSGADIRRRGGERWQAWEQRLAWLHGLPTVTVAVVDDDGTAALDADVVLARATLGRDVRERLLPALSAAEPDPTAPLALAQAQVRTARAEAKAHPVKTLWRAGSGGVDGEPALAGLMRRVGGESEAARAFANDGYVVLGRFLDRGEVVALRAEVERALAAPRDPSCERPHNTLVPLRWDDAVVDRVVADDVRRRRLATVTGGDDLRWISGYLSLKEPASAPLWWHQDWWCWDHPISYEPGTAQVAVLCYLTPTDEETAALRVLPGSHRERTALHAVLPEAHAQAAEDLDLAHPAMTDHPDQVTLRLAPGDAVVADYRLLHGTHPNRGAVRRDCVLLTFAPSWRTLPADIRGHLIRHPALPDQGEAADRPWLPSYDGPRADLPLNRVAYPTRIGGPASPEKITR